MCGIIGYIGERQVIPILLKGLKRMEYRGYDSAGIAIIHNNELKIFKDSGMIDELQVEHIPSTIGIGHTRWATHGIPSRENAHPHIDCNKDIAIVHNGIIENYEALKQLLISEGHTFRSDTDTEVLAHLIEKFYTNNLETAVMKAIKLIDGAFAIAVIHKNEEKIVFARKSSPLILGIGEKEFILASDAAAILEHTKRVIYIDDNELGVITPNSFSIMDIDGNHLDKEIVILKNELEEIEKQGFKHFMLKEIYEQPQAILNTLRGRLKQEIKLSFDIPENINRIIISACGTSWHAALIGKFIIERLARINVEVDYASEFRYRDPVLSKNDLFIAISQSGETADTLAALRLAKKKGVKTMGIVNVVGSTIAREVDFGIYTHAGIEIGVASTKAFTTQIVALMLFALKLVEQQDKHEDIRNELMSLPSKIKQILELDKDIREIAKFLVNKKNVLYLGRGINYPIALEGALKLKEISYIHAEGYPAAEMKHGPIALIDEDMPVIFIANKGPLLEKVISNMQEVYARQGKIITITDVDDERIKKLSHRVIKIPSTHELLSPILNVIPLQLLAYHVADLKGLSIDKPRNLAKSVTVE